MLYFVLLIHLTTITKMEQDEILKALKCGMYRDVDVNNLKISILGSILGKKLNNLQPSLAFLNECKENLVPKFPTNINIAAFFSPENILDLTKFIDNNISQLNKLSN